MKKSKAIAQKSTLSGSAEEAFTCALFNQLQQTLGLTSQETREAKENKVAAFIAAMRCINPQDEIEGMLAAQMVATHNAAMECFKEAASPVRMLEVRAVNLSQANKLVRSYATLLEALAKYRSKGVVEQKVTVQHVHVTDGGRAVIGNVRG